MHSFPYVLARIWDPKCFVDTSNMIISLLKMLVRGTQVELIIVQYGVSALGRSVAQFSRLTG